MTLPLDSNSTFSQINLKFKSNFQSISEHYTRTITAREEDEDLNRSSLLLWFEGQRCVQRETPGLSP